MSLFQPSSKIQVDIIPGAVLTEDDTIVFEKQIFTDWTREQEMAAMRDQFIAAGAHLDYLRWLRDATLPDQPTAP